MDGIYEVVIGGVSKGNYAENVVHYVVQGTSSSDPPWLTAKELCDAFYTGVVIPLSNCMGTDALLNVLYARRVDGPGGPSYQKPISVGGGDSPNNCFSQVVAIDCALYPGGASNRLGRFYLWGCSVVGIIADVVQAYLLTLITTFLTHLLTTLTVGSGTADNATYTKSSNTATINTAGVSRPKISGFSKRTAPVT